MSIEIEVGLQQAVQPTAELEYLVDRIVASAIARIECGALKPFITSKECAELIDVTPEHSCQWRARGEDRPGAGPGQWTRSERPPVLTWLPSLPRQTDHSCDEPKQ